MHESIDNEVVVVNLDNGTYYSFDGIAGRLWEWLDGNGQSLEGLIAKATAVFTGESGQIAEAVERFVSQLRDEQLVSVDNAEAAPATDLPTNGGQSTADAVPFREPVLQKYTDMEALLLVDPIHEVDEEQGWPIQK